METLALEDYRRYGRQMILDGLGLAGQLKLQQAAVVVVGAGGLGCPALQYLAAAGIGRIGIIDHDIVELSNLQRQILHTEQSLGIHKTESAAQAIKKLNSRVHVDAIAEALSAANAAPLLRPYDLILDCTDNAPTRYLLSDIAVALGTPLVSGAAQKFDGQLCTYNLGATGPCYRCLFPTPPAPEATGSCEETGILGAVTGVIGTLQALEAVKILTGLHDAQPRMLLFSSLGVPPFRSITLRAKKAACAACGEEGRRVGALQDVDYVRFCGGLRPNWERQGLVEGNPGCRIRAKDFKRVLEARTGLNVIDVRPRTEYGICQLPGTINVPLSDLVADPAAYLPAHPATDTYVVCRLGNDSQIAAAALRDAAEMGSERVIQDIIGGLGAWARDVDVGFPVY